MSLISNTKSRKSSGRSEMGGMVRDVTTAAVGIAGISMLSNMVKK